MSILKQKIDTYIEYTKRKTQSGNYCINDPKAFIHVLSPAFVRNLNMLGTLYNSLHEQGAGDLGKTWKCKNCGSKF